MLNVLEFQLKKLTLRKKLTLCNPHFALRNVNFDVRNVKKCRSPYSVPLRRGARENALIVREQGKIKGD